MGGEGGREKNEPGLRTKEEMEEIEIRILRFIHNDDEVENRPAI
jgi:hypothetical protein